MELFLAYVSASTAVLGVLGSFFHFSVIKPLNQSIQSQQSLLDRLDATVDKLEEKRQDLVDELSQLKVTVESVNQNAKSAHKRIDQLIASAGMPGGLNRRASDRG